MTISGDTLTSMATLDFSSDRAHASTLSEFLTHVDETFGVSFCAIDVDRGEVVRPAADWKPALDGWFVELLASIVGKKTAEFVADEDPIALLALPLGRCAGRRIVAIAPVVTHVPSPEPVDEAVAKWLGMSAEDADLWTRSQPTWPTAAVSRVGKSAIRHWEALVDRNRMRKENEQIAVNLTITYEEICLLHRVSQSLRLTRTDEELAGPVLESLPDCVPASGFAILYLPLAKDGECIFKTRTTPTLVSQGAFPSIDADALREAIEELGVDHRKSILVRNLSESVVDCPLPQARQLIVVAIAEGERVLGWLLACNQRDGREFGGVEANLLASVAVMLGIHCGNRDLYRQQSEFLANVVQGLTSAIDAKDPYTCGHSDRVARIAVRLAKECGCDSRALQTIYMGGLLHDIGKIGVSDAVLGKHGALTPEEFNHIKTHPEKGYRILADIRQLADVLPAVLHHHEQWDGRGYPCELEGEQIPRIARILAVADAFDAMSSDRPYRKGMPYEKVIEVFRRGRAAQWDPEVIDAFFRCADEIRDIAKHERANLTLNVQEWT